MQSFTFLVIVFLEVFHLLHFMDTKVIHILYMEENADYGTTKFNDPIMPKWN